MSSILTSWESIVVVTIVVIITLVLAYRHDRKVNQEKKRRHNELLIALRDLEERVKNANKTSKMD